MPQTGRVSERYPARPQWRRVSLGRGHTLDLLHARVAQAFAPHVHEAFALGACTDGLEVISYRGGLHYAGPGSVVILEPGEPHTGRRPRGRASCTGSCTPAPTCWPMSCWPKACRAGVAGRGLGLAAVPRAGRHGPGAGLGTGRVHAGLSQDPEPLEAESRLSWLLGELVRRHASPGPELVIRRPAGAGCPVPGAWPARS